MRQGGVLRPAEIEQQRQTVRLHPVLFRQTFSQKDTQHKRHIGGPSRAPPTTQCALPATPSVPA